METNEEIYWEGNYIHTGNGMHGKVVWHDSTTMNVKWYPARQWFIIVLWLAFWKWAAQHRMHLTAFGVGVLAFLAGFGICWLVFVR